MSKHIPVTINFTQRQFFIFLRLMESTRDVTEDRKVHQTCIKAVKAAEASRHMLHSPKSG